MDKHALEIIKQESFLQLSLGALNDLLSQDSFYAPEIEIFSAVQSWVKANPGIENNEVLSKKKIIFYHLLEIKNFIKINLI